MSNPRKAVISILLILAALCFGALLDGLPYKYFQLLRWAVCCGGAYVAVQLWKPANGFAWGCLALAVLFNPFFKFYLGRHWWQAVDFVAGIYFLLVAIWVKRRF